MNGTIEDLSRSLRYPKFCDQRNAVSLERQDELGPCPWERGSRSGVPK